MTFPRVCRYWRCRLAFTVTKHERRMGVVYCSAACGYRARGLDAFGRKVCVAHLTPTRAA